MNRLEALQVLAILEANYPVRYQQDAMVKEFQLETWERAFSDVSFDLVKVCVTKLILSSKWQPTIAEVREEVAKIMRPEIYDRGSEDAYRDVQKAIRIYGRYRIAEMLKGLDELTRKTIEAIGGFTAFLDDENEMALRAQWRKAYETYERRAKEEAVLPHELKEQIEAMRIQAQDNKPFNITEKIKEAGERIRLEQGRRL